MKELKKIQALVDITNYLADHNFTYDEVSEFMTMLQNEISASREQNEYETANDWYNNIPCCNIGKAVIVPLNRVDVKGVIFSNI